MYSVTDTGSSKQKYGRSVDEIKEKFYLRFLLCGVMKITVRRVMLHDESPSTVLEPGSSHVGFVVEKVALGHLFSEYFCFPCPSSFHQFHHNHHHLSSRAGTIGQ
jgi:hypothetical protein